MPVFHTKTIESILEPVAQQVSKLVILHEDVANGNRIPDLSEPVKIVKMAADNLIKVGYETVNTSDDNILKQEMPQALNRVEEACKSLQGASELLKIDPASSVGKKQLIDGERGILQGVSAILLTFDESEVRKIVQICKQVLEYLLITEVIETMEDLVTYVKNLTPVLTRMAREVDSREKELTHQYHRELLAQNLEEIKYLTPTFISSIKIYLAIKTQHKQQKTDVNGLYQAEENRNFIIRKLCDKINEIIRVLQLTTYDEDEWISDDLTVMRQRLNNFEGRIKHASEWLLDKNLVTGSFGEKAFKNSLEDALVIASKIQNTEQSEFVKAECEKLNVMLNSLHKLSQDGKLNTPNAKQLAALMNDNFINLYDTLKAIVGNAHNYGLRKIEPTIFGKVEQASKWCINPFVDDKGIGEEAARRIIEEGLKVGVTHKDSQIRDDFIKNSNECELFVNKLSQSQRNGTNSVEALAIGKQLQDRLYLLGQKITHTLIQQYADDFVDVNYPLKKLHEAATSPYDTPNRETVFANASKLFKMHTDKLCDTARQIANSTSNSRNKRVVETINELATQNIELAPQVLNAAQIVYTQPDNKLCLEHFELMQKQWQDNMDRMRVLVDSNVDPAIFVRACEYSILKDTHKIEASVKEQNSYEIVTNTSNIARRANRIVQIAAQEIENSEDSGYVQQITEASNMLKSSVPPMINCAKQLALHPDNEHAFENWSNANQKVIDSVVQVREAVLCDNTDDTASTSAISSASNVPDFSSLHINKVDDNAPPRPPPPAKDLYPERPPPPLPNETDDESEIDFPMPETNQPILMAAHDLHVNVDQWSSRDNDLIAVAKRITLLMAKLNDLVRDETGNKKDLIATAKRLADESTEITRLAKQLANECTDKRMKNNLLQVCNRIPTIGTQLKILSTVKATMLGVQGSKEDEEATEMLIVNAQNLNASVKETVQAAKAASIKIRTDSGIKFKWVRKRPHYKSFHH